MIENAITLTLDHPRERVFEFVLTPQGTRTQVEIRMRLRPHGAMLLLQPLMRRKIGQFLADLPGHIQAGLDSASSRA